MRWLVSLGTLALVLLVMAPASVAGVTLPGASTAALPVPTVQPPSLPVPVPTVPPVPVPTVPWRGDDRARRHDGAGRHARERQRREGGRVGSPAGGGRGSRAGGGNAAGGGNGGGAGAVPSGGVLGESAQQPATLLPPPDEPGTNWLPWVVLAGLLALLGFGVRALRATRG